MADHPPTPPPTPPPSPPAPAPAPAPARVVIIVDQNPSFLANTGSRLREFGISPVMVQNSLHAAQLLRISHPTTYHCSVCSDIFDSAEEEQQHVADCMLKSMFLDLYNPKRTCQLCDRANNVSVDALNRHAEKENGTSCGQCGKNFPTELGLARHLAAHQRADNQHAADQKRILLRHKLHNIEQRLRDRKLSTKPGLVLASETSGTDAIRVLADGKVHIVVLAVNQNIGLESYAGAHDLFRLPLGDGDLAKIQGYIQQ